MAKTLITAPTDEPVSVEEVKDHLRVYGDDEDILIGGLITAAREHVERVICNRALITQTWDLYLDAFPASGCLIIPMPPLQSVTSVKYTPDGGSEQTFSDSNYIVDTVNEPGKIVLTSSASWPNDVLQPVNGVVVRFVAGYGDEPTDVSERFKQAIKLLVGDMYENREDSVIGAGISVTNVPWGVHQLLYSLRMWPI